jgi:zinc-ribbon domain
VQGRPHGRFQRGCRPLSTDKTRITAAPVAGLPSGAPPACPHCGADVVPDQRYCLACGRPCSPVRLAFLDVLQAEHAQALHARPAAVAHSAQLTAAPGQGLPPAGTVLPPVVAYAPPPEQGGVSGWLRRHSGLLGLMTVLLLAGLIGLLVGHWVSGTKLPSQYVVKNEYPNGLPLANQADTSPTSTTPSSSSAGPASSAASTKPSAAAPASSGPESEAQEEKEVKEAEAEAKNLPKPVKPSTSTLQHIENSTGKKHEEEINKLSNGIEPIETGG